MNEFNGDGELHNKPAHAVPLASARQHPENQKENQAGHSSERAVEGQSKPEPEQSGNSRFCSFPRRKKIERAPIKAACDVPKPSAQTRVLRRRTPFFCVGNSGFALKKGPQKASAVML